MKKLARYAFVCLVVGMIADPTLAQFDPDSDGFCICFDVDAAEGCNCIQAVAESQVTAYLVITSPTAAGGITGLEFALDVVGGGFLDPEISWAAPANIMGPPGVFFVDFSTPLPAAPMVILAEMTFAVFNDEPIFIYLKPVPNVIIDPPPVGVMAYYSTSQPEPHQLHPCTGYDEFGDPNPVACINCDCEDVVSAQKSSWGSIKSLYR